MSTLTGPSASDADDGLDFLAQSDQPGSLGRLGHYEVLEVARPRRHGIVLRAFDEMLHRVVAIKVLAPQLAASAAARKRFLREAQAAAAVSHEHVVTIHAVEEAGRCPTWSCSTSPGRRSRSGSTGPGPLQLPRSCGSACRSPPGWPRPTPRA